MKQLEPNGLTMVDFFCGAGVGAVGFQNSGFNIIDAIDNKEYAVRTYNNNIGNHARLIDIKKLKSEDVSYADLYVGTPPCTTFSLGGKGEGVNNKNVGDLGWHFLKKIEDNKPKSFVMENVKGLVSKKHIDFFNALMERFNEIGYDVSYKVMNCYEYGVPQLRERVFIVGFRKDLEVNFKFPEVVPEEERKNLYDAIGDLPIEAKDYTGTIKNHNKYYEGGFSSRYISRNRQKQWNEPSFTIVSTSRQLPLHPHPPNYDIRKMHEDHREPPRRFTVRECLRLQTVPDSFYFEDDIHLDKQYERCSGIPSLIAYKLGEQIAKALKNK